MRTPKGIPWCRPMIDPFPGAVEMIRQDERVYRHALTQLGLSSDEVWMVGDHLIWDVADPKRLGMRGICD